MLLLVLRGRVVSVLAIAALQRNHFPHGSARFQSLRSALFKFRLLNDVRDRAGADGVAAFANREAQALFQRHRSD